MFFFITLYMQNVLGYSPIQAGSAYLPVTLGVGVAAGVCSQLFARTGTRPIIVAGALLAAGGVYWLSRIPVHGSYLTDLLPGLMIMSLGLGAVFVGVQTAANAGVPPDKAGLAAALVNASQQLGAALGLAIFSGDRHLPHPPPAGRPTLQEPTRSPRGSTGRCSPRASSSPPPPSSRYAPPTPEAKRPHPRSQRFRTRPRPDGKTSPHAHVTPIKETHHELHTPDPL